MNRKLLLLPVKGDRILGHCDHLGFGFLVDDVGFELEEPHALPKHVHPLQHIAEYISDALSTDKFPEEIVPAQTFRFRGRGKH